MVSISRRHAGPRSPRGWNAPGSAPDFAPRRPVPILLNPYGVILMHSRPKEQREAVRNLVHTVLTRDMGTFNPERFKDWIKEIDARFRKVGLTLGFTIQHRSVHFTIKEMRTSRMAFKFTSSTHVPFEDRDVVMTVEEFASKSRC
jgi:hypothetical protein